MQKILVTGATGFTGSHTVHALIAAGYDVVCFVRENSDRRFLPVDKVAFAIGNLEDCESLTAALSGCEALVNIASLGQGHADNIVKGIEASQVKRAIFISTTALFTNLNAGSKTARIAAEKRVKDSSLDYTLLRPTMIYGNARDRNICRLVRYIKKWPVLPVFGSGEFLLQPIHVDDVAQAIVKALGSTNTIKKAYNISGAKALTYNQLATETKQACNRRVALFHLPHIPLIWLLRHIERWIRLPIKAEQIERLNEHKDFSHIEAHNDFGFAPRSFKDGILQEIKAITLYDEQA